MRKRKLEFPGLDSCSSEKMCRDVVTDRENIMRATQNLRKQESMSLEEVGFVLGVQAGQLSRQLNGEVGMTLANYIRLVRALGYRCQITFTKTSFDASNTDLRSDLKVNSHPAVRERQARSIEGA